METTTAIILGLSATAVAALLVLMKYLDLRSQREARTMQSGDSTQGKLWEEVNTLRGRTDTLNAQLDEQRDRYYREREATHTQIVRLYARIQDLDGRNRILYNHIEDLYNGIDGLPDHGVSVRAALRSVRPLPPPKSSTGPLVAGPALVGVLPPAAQQTLVQLLAETWMAESKAGRDAFLVGLPTAFTTSLTRPGQGIFDLTEMIDRAATWGHRPGEPLLLARLLENVAALLNGSSDGAALVAWRARWGLELEQPIEGASTDGTG